MPYGRGGAGNIEAAHWNAVAAANRKASDDLEANKSAAETQSKGNPGATLGADLRTEDEVEDLQREKEQQRATQEFAHMGRGGAGNYYSPRNLQSSGTYSASGPISDATSAPTRPPALEQTTESRHRGRGGAGNYIWTQSDQDSAKKETNEQQELELKELIRDDVESQLQRPDKAYFLAKQGKDPGERVGEVEGLRSMWS